MDWSLFQPRAKRFLLRDELGYSNHIYVSPIDRNPRESVCVRVRADMYLQAVLSSYCQLDVGSSVVCDY